MVFDFSLMVPTGEVLWSIEVIDTQPQGADFWGFCSGPYNPATGTAFPYCSTDEPIAGFGAAGTLAPFDIATAIFGFDPGLNPPSVTTPEPSTRGLLLVAGCFLCGLSHYAFAWRKKASHSPKCLWAAKPGNSRGCIPLSNLWLSCEE